MEANAWNRALDKLAAPDSDCYSLVHTAADSRVLDHGKTHLPKVLAYGRYAADYFVTGVAKGVAMPLVCSVGAAASALQAPGAQRALVVLVPEAALVGGAVWGAAGAIVQGGCAAGCVLGAGYHLTAAGYNGARRVVGRAAQVTVQAVSAAAQVTQRAVEAAWIGIINGIQSL